MKNKPWWVYFLVFCTTLFLINLLQAAYYIIDGNFWASVWYLVLAAMLFRPTKEFVKGDYF